MANINGSNVNITFDGLLCFDLDREHKLCKIEVHTAAESHIMKITVKPENGQITRKTLSQEKLKELNNLYFFVSDEEGIPLPPSVENKGSFDKILNLASEYFYKSKREVRKGMYGCSIWLQDGTIDAGDLDTCHRVKEALFSNLKFEWECKQEWEGFKRGAQAVDREAIKDFSSTFARNVTSTITLQTGQSLQMKSLKTNEMILGPLAAGLNYEITIEYADVFPPTGLFDCKGFAYHCEALDLDPAEDIIYGIFKPSRFKDEADTQLSTATESGCCECCRNDGPSSGNLIDEFQQLVSVAARPEINRRVKPSAKAKK